MKMFVVAANIFCVLMFLVYAFLFPIDNDTKEGKLYDLYNTLMVFEGICAFLIICQIFTGARRLEALNPEYGKYIKIQGLVFLVGNLVAGTIYCLMGKQILVFTKLNFFVNLPIQFIFYTFSELFPLISYIYCQRKFVEAIMPELFNPDGDNNNRDEQQNG